MSSLTLVWALLSSLPSLPADGRPQAASPNRSSVRFRERPYFHAWIPTHLVLYKNLRRHPPLNGLLALHASSQLELKEPRTRTLLYGTGEGRGGCTWRAILGQPSAALGA